MTIQMVRPLKIENPAEGGSQTDLFPTEANPVQDYAALLGVAFGGDTGFTLAKIGRTISELMPDATYTMNYTTQGDLDYVEFFNS